MKEFEKESGESVLMLGRIFHEKVLFMKKQLMFAEHPVKKVIEKFKNLFVESNMVLLCRQVDDDEDEPLADATYERKMKYLYRVVLKTINLLVDILIQFYSMED